MPAALSRNVEGRFRSRLRCVIAAGCWAVQADGLTSRYCRRSVPLTQLLTGFGLELAGRAGARLAGKLGIAVHSSTILRLLAGLPGREAGTAPGNTRHR
jgi:hypothetical protein